MSDSRVLVHAYMIYRCEKCNKVFRMWCEKGIEDGTKPSPFIIGHKCGGLAKDISGLYRINYPFRNRNEEFRTNYMILPEEESYFANKNNCDHGVAVFRGEENACEQ